MLVFVCVCVCVCLSTALLLLQTDGAPPPHHSDQSLEEEEEEGIIDKEIFENAEGIEGINRLVGVGIQQNIKGWKFWTRDTSPPS